MKLYKYSQIKGETMNNEINQDVLAVIYAAVSAFSEQTERAKKLTKKIRTTNKIRNGISTMQDVKRRCAWKRNIETA
jgi:hypothetical protein